MQNPDGELVIEVTGLRPGEKLYEELLIGNNPQKTVHPRIMKAHEEFIQLERLAPLIDKLLLLIDKNAVQAAIDLLREIVPEFQAEKNIRFILE